MSLSQNRARVTSSTRQANTRERGFLMFKTPYFDDFDEIFHKSV